MPQDPLGPFGQYITAPLNPTQENQPTGYEGWGGALAHVATQFLNGAKQQRAQKFALQAQQEQKEEDAYNTALQHVEASGLSPEDKETWKARLAQPLLQRMAANKEVTSKDTGHPGTDFLRGIAQNLVGGQLPGKKQPLDLSLPMQAVAYASAPENSTRYKASLLDAKAAEILQEVEHKAKAEGRVPTSDDLQAHPMFGTLISEYGKVAPGKVPPVFNSYLGERSVKSVTPIQTQAKVDAGIATYRKAKGLAEDAEIPKDELDRILVANGVMKAAPVVKTGVQLNRQGAALGDRFPFKTDLYDQPVNPKLQYASATRNGVEGIVPVNGRSQFQSFRGMENGKPVFFIKDTLTNETHTLPEYSPIVPAGTSVLSGVNSSGAGYTVRSNSFLPGGAPAPGNTFVPGASVSTPNVAPVQQGAPAPVAPTSGASVAPPVNKTATPPVIKPPTNGNPWARGAKPQAQAQVQAQAAPAAPATPPGGVYPKLVNVPPIVGSINVSLGLISKLKAALSQTDPATGKPYYEENTIMDAATQQGANFIYNKLHMSPGEWQSYVQPLASLTSIQGAANFLTSGSRADRFAQEVQQHIPNAKDTPRNMMDKLTLMERELPEVAREVAENARTKMIPRIIMPGQAVGSNPVQAPLPPAVKTYVAPKI